jgi:hypothetical protein
MCEDPCGKQVPPFRHGDDEQVFKFSILPKQNLLLFLYILFQTVLHFSVLLCQRVFTSGEAGVTSNYYTLRKIKGLSIISFVIIYVIILC